MLSAIVQHDSEFWFTVENIRKKRCFQELQKEKDKSALRPLP